MPNPSTPMRPLVGGLLALVALAAGCKTGTNSGVLNASTQQTLQTSSVRQLNSSVMMMGNWDYGLNNGTNNCMNVVDRAMIPGVQSNGTLNFVPTHYFIAQQQNGQEVATQFCHSRNGNCPGFDSNSIAAFQNGMQACFQHAIALGTNISVTPHLDDGKGSGVWRNNVQFDPYPAGSDNCTNPNQSYFCFMLKPMAQALNATLKPGIKVYFATQGEMGATVFRFPEQYNKILPMLKSIILAGRSDLNPADIHVGLSVNHESIFGQVRPDQINSGNVKTLFNTADFLGVSAYLASDPYPYPTMFDNAYDAFDSELAQINLELKHDAPNLELDFSEIGIGGGINGGQVAKTRRDCANATWDGIGASYAKSNDPWQTPDCATVRREYYCAVAAYMSGNVTTKWKVSRAFIWNLGSWDVQNVYPNSVDSTGAGYGDSQVMAWLRDYNLSGAAPCSSNNPPNIYGSVYPMLEDFSKYTQQDLERAYSYNPSSNHLSQSLVSAVGSLNSAGMQLTYRIGSGSDTDPSYIGLSRSIYPPSQAAQTWGIKFHLAYNAPNNSGAKRYFIFQVTDKQNHTWEKVIPLTGNLDTDEWAVYSDGFTKPCWYTGADYGKPSPGNIATISYYVNGAMCNETPQATPSGQQESVAISSLIWEQ